jgi:hypothetical protein
MHSTRLPSWAVQPLSKTVQAVSLKSILRLSMMRMTAFNAPPSSTCCSDPLQAPLAHDNKPPCVNRIARQLDRNTGMYVGGRCRVGWSWDLVVWHHYSAHHVLHTHPETWPQWVITRQQNKISCKLLWTLASLLWLKCSVFGLADNPGPPSIMPHAHNWNIWQTFVTWEYLPLCGKSALVQIFACYFPLTVSQCGKSMELPSFGLELVLVLQLIYIAFLCGNYHLWPPLSSFITKNLADSLIVLLFCLHRMVVM